MAIELDTGDGSKSALVRIWRLIYPDGDLFTRPDEVPAHVERALQAERQATAHMANEVRELQAQVYDLDRKLREGTA